MLYADTDGMILISIHALRKESDREGPSDALALAISIHALRKESDRRAVGRWRARRDFNPRSP